PAVELLGPAVPDADVPLQVGDDDRARERVDHGRSTDLAVRQIAQLTAHALFVIGCPFRPKSPTTSAPTPGALLTSSHLPTCSLFHPAFALSIAQAGQMSRSLPSAATSPPGSKRCL